MLALHDPLDDVADVAAGAWSRMCSAICSGLELLVEVATALPSFAIPLSTAIEPIFAARDGMIPCQPTPPCITPGDLLDPARQEVRERRQARAAGSP